ncbi:MAG: murein biosynthesis integral membrane protein MurJ [Deltaproteobacteria bacterium]|nr:murein biosynthesis integral membrane protein MurJ [Deltaproteobacteria bacterium]MBW1846863.1 murein biosynthesis integral membrane protein MurJ [Deltaproteobacteria bacterium]MBW2179867.1 murein biosynthesis integral membrane protein MurJ [Deltaproteobacteria bacterium]
MSENHQMTRAAGVVGSSTLLSRIFGYIRDMVFAWFFGAGLVSDAFIAAFQIPNLLRRLFGEGSLSIAFIPVFTEYLTKYGKKEAFRLASSALRLLSVILVFIAILGIAISPFIIKLIAPGFYLSPEKYELTVTLTRIMFPYIIFICLVALSMGILNALGHFAAPALAPVLLNITMIGSLFIVSFFSNSQEHKVLGLAIGVLAGGILQLSFQVPFLLKKGFYFWEKTKIFHPGLKKIGTLMLPAIFGAAVYQVNIIVGRMLASMLAEGSVSYLYYADRLVQFPLGIFAIATATAALPTLAKQSSLLDIDGLRNTFTHALNLVFFIAIPSMTGLIVLREPIVALLFKRGAFDALATQKTATALMYYGFGLWAFSGVRIVVSAFYAMQDTKAPVRIAVISILANILLGLLLMMRLDHGGLALATSIASMLNLGLLLKALRKKIGFLGWRNITMPTCKTVLCSVIMGIIVWIVSICIIPSIEISFLNTLFGLLGCILTGIIVYVLASFLFRSSELIKIADVVINRARRR